MAALSRNSQGASDLKLTKLNRLRLGGHWQLSTCGDKNVAVTVRALQLESCLYRRLFFFQYRMDFTETARVCALLLRIRKDRRKKRHWVHPVVSKRLLNGQFYKLYEDLKNSRGKFFSCIRMSVESFDKPPVLVGARITYENTRLRLSVHHKRDWQEHSLHGAESFLRS